MYFVIFEIKSESGDITDVNFIQTDMQSKCKFNTKIKLGLRRCKMMFDLDSVSHWSGA